MKENRTKKATTLIIGSGVAGAAISQKLLDKDPDASILMLEAGTKVEMKNFADYQEYMITGKRPYDFCEDENYPDRDTPGENISNDKELAIRGSRLLMYGGSTVHWGGWSFRLHPEDFKLKTNTGFGIDWPLDYDKFEEYYEQAERYIGVSGGGIKDEPYRKANHPYPAFPFTLEDNLLKDAFDEKDYSYIHMPIARHGITATDSVHAPCQTTGTCKYCPFGARYVASNYIDDMKKYNDYPGFEIQTGAFVQHIVMDSKEHAKGVVYKDVKSGEIFEVEADRVIVAAGAIESAKILLRSTSNLWDNGIGNDHDLVGRNFITHPYFSYQAKINNNPKRLQPEMDFPTLVSRYFDSLEEQKKGKFILMSPPSSPESVDSDGSKTSIEAMMQNGMTREVMDVEVKGDAIVQIQGIIEVFSEAKNRVRNFDKINHLGLIETKVTYQKPDTFDARMEEVQGHITELFKLMGADVDTIENNMMSWRADHAACVTRMSDSPETGVVDSDLKVFGTDNLFVCSNASFSTLGAVNPTLTLAALSLKLGDYLNKN